MRIRSNCRVTDFRVLYEDVTVKNLEKERKNKEQRLKIILYYLTSSINIPVEIN